MATLEIITGPMFSGKSDELIHRLKLATYADMRVVVVKPKSDSRQGKEIVSRERDAEDSNFKNHASFPAFEIENPEDLRDLIKEHKPDVLGIDEAQFLKAEFVSFIKRLLEGPEGRRLKIIMAGLDLTSENEPFGQMPTFFALADDVVKLRAVCFCCKEWPPTANMSYFREGRKIDQVKIGDAETYGACCRRCWPILSK